MDAAPIDLHGPLHPVGQPEEGKAHGPVDDLEVGLEPRILEPTPDVEWSGDEAPHPGDALLEDVPKEKQIGPLHIHR